MAQEFPNQSRSSPEDLTELRAEIAALAARVEALERGQVSRAVLSEPEANTRESGLGLKVVNRIGAITLALGILFFFRYAAENNWIGPTARVVLGFFAGLGFLWFAEYLNRRAQGVLSQGVAGCGIAILYIASYAASAYYKLLLHEFSFGLLLCICACGWILGLRYRAQVLTGFAVGLAFFALPVMRTDAYVGLSFPSLLITAAAGVWIAAQQEWVILGPFTAAAGLLSAGVVEQSALWFVLFCFLLTALLWYTRSRVTAGASVKNALYVAGHGCLLVGGLRWIGAEWSETSVVLTVASVLLALYGIALLSAGVLRNVNVDRVTGLSLIGLVIAKLYLYDVWRLSYGFRITAFVLLGVLLLLASFVYSRYKAHG